MGKLRQLLVYTGVVFIGLIDLNLHHLPNYFLTANTSTNVAVDPRLAVYDTQNYEPIKVCNQVAPFLPGDDIRIMRKYSSSCPLLNNQPEHTTILLLDNKSLFGRTGNNLIEFFHSLQYGRDKGIVIGMMRDSWPT